jgi:hypothetical protein
MKEDLDLTVVYNHDNSIRSIYLDDIRVYGGKIYASENLRHEFMKVKTTAIHAISAAYRPHHAHLSSTGEGSGKKEKQ